MSLEGLGRVKTQFTMKLDVRMAIVNGFRLRVD